VRTRHRRRVRLLLLPQRSQPPPHTCHPAPQPRATPCKLTC
jgi:hypothetical protein